MSLARRLVKAAIAVTVPHPSQIRFVAGIPESPKTSLARQTVLASLPRISGGQSAVARTGQSTPTGLTEHFSELAWTVGRGGAKFSSDGFLSGFESEALEGLTKEALFKELFQTISRRMGPAKATAAPKPTPELQKILKARGIKKEIPTSQPIAHQGVARQKEPGAVFGREASKIHARYTKREPRLKAQQRQPA